MIIKYSLKIDLIMPEPHNVKFPTPHPHGPTTPLTIVLCHHYYRPQRSCEGFVFTGVCLSTGGGCLVGGVSAPGGGGVPACTEADTPPGETAPAADGRHPTRMHSCFKIKLLS